MATIGPFADLGAKLSDPAVDRGGIDRHPALAQQRRGRCGTTAGSDSTSAPLEG